MDCRSSGSLVHEIFPGKNTGVGCHAHLQGIFLTQRSNPHLLCLLHCRWILYERATREVSIIRCKCLCCCSVTQSCPVTPWTAAWKASLSLIIFQNLSKFMFIASVMPSSHLILWCPLLHLPSIFPSITEFSSESSVHIRWPKYWRFSFSISPPSEYSGLISLKIDWFDLLAGQRTLRSLLQHHSSKASILWRSAFFKV